jgi:phosphotransferase system HPr-like phosphotransfer protein
MKVILNNVSEVEEFVNAATACPSEIDLKSGVIYLDAKSLLGVMSLGMKRELQVICAEHDERFLNRVRKFAIA